MKAMSAMVSESNIFLPKQGFPSLGTYEYSLSMPYLSPDSRMSSSCMH